MPRVRTDRLPATSHLWPLHRPGDFLDGYSVPSTLTPRQAAERGLALPGWAMALLGLRNALVRPLGLKSGASKSGARDARDGLFPVLADTPDEYVVGLDDRHLDFRISVMRHAGRIHMATWVRPHNAWGRAYLRLVMPAHILISRGAVARMAA